MGLMTYRKTFANTVFFTMLCTHECLQCGVWQHKCLAFLKAYLLDIMII